MYQQKKRENGGKNPQSSNRFKSTFANTKRGIPIPIHNLCYDYRWCRALLRIIYLMSTKKSRSLSGFFYF